jgi:hypothetical protein
MVGAIASVLESDKRKPTVRKAVLMHGLRRTLWRGIVLAREAAHHHFGRVFACTASRSSPGGRVVLTKGLSIPSVQKPRSEP